MNKNTTLPVNLEEFIEKIQKEGDIEHFASKLVEEYFKKIQDRDTFN